MVLNDVENKSKRYAVSYSGYYYGYGKYDDYISKPEVKKIPKFLEVFKRDR